MFLPLHWWWWNLLVKPTRGKKRTISLSRFCKKFASRLRSFKLRVLCRESKRSKMQSPKDMEWSVNGADLEMGDDRFILASQQLTQDLSAGCARSQCQSVESCSVYCYGADSMDLRGIAWWLLGYCNECTRKMPCSSSVDARARAGERTTEDPRDNRQPVRSSNWIIFYFLRKYYYLII